MIRAVWQISGGPASRAYTEVVLKYGVGLIGPGWPGPWKPGLPDEDFEGRFVRQLASEVHVGDVLLLREGIASIRAIGLVASEYQYLPQFEDVEGCDLQHGRRVRWRELPQRHDFETLVL